MIEDLKSSFNSVLKDRIVSPISGAFIVSWCLWNLPLLYYIFTVDSKIPVETRLDCIRTEYFNRYDGFIYPFLSSIFVTVVYPIVSGAASLLITRVNAFFRNETLKIQKTVTIPIEESVSLIESLDKEKERSLVLFKEKQAKIVELSSEIEKLKQQNEFEVLSLEEDRAYEMNKASQEIEELRKENMILIETKLKFDQAEVRVHEKLSAHSIQLDKAKKQLFGSKLLQYQSILMNIHNKGLHSILETLETTLGEDEIATIPNVSKQAINELSEMRIISLINSDKYTITSLGKDILLLKSLSINLKSF